MRIAVLLYTHRHGVDVIPVRVQEHENLPEITNELLSDLGVEDPELDIRDDEFAEWSEIWKVDEIPVLKRRPGMLDWDPEA